MAGEGRRSFWWCLDVFCVSHAVYIHTPNKYKSPWCHFILLTVTWRFFLSSGCHWLSFPSVSQNKPSFPAGEAQAGICLLENLDSKAACPFWMLARVRQELWQKSPSCPNFWWLQLDQRMFFAPALFLCLAWDICPEGPKSELWVEFEFLSCGRMWNTWEPSLSSRVG